MSDWKTHILDGTSWLRVLLVALFYFLVLQIVLPIIVGVCALIQAGFLLVTGDSNERLRAFTASFNVWVGETLEYVTFNSERGPFPMSDYPESSDSESP